MAEFARRFVPGFLAVSLWMALPAAAQEAPEPGFCEILATVLDSAEQRDGFAAIEGTDAGNYRETTARLPGGKFCKVAPDRWPSAVWDCLLSDQGKYTMALQIQGKWKTRIIECLDDRWVAERPEDDSVLASTVFTRAGSVTRIRLLTTREVTAANGWRPHRIVLQVYSPRPEIDPATVGY
jgi:hypothetical protein